MNNGMRVYMGSGDICLDRCIHQHQLTYHTDKQLGYFTDYDEFYWNVTGTGWQFPILKATATIDLPAQARVQVKKQYRIRKLQTKRMNKLSKSEHIIKDKLFKGKQAQIILSKSPNPYLRVAKSKLNSVLQDEYKKKCFIDNSFYMIWLLFIFWQLKLFI